MKHIIALVILFLMPFTTIAQNSLSERYNMAYLNMSTGLPSNFVDDVYSDSYGFVWIATHGGGLVRYDGFNYMYFGIGSHGLSLRSNTCHSITEDRFHRLWVAFEEYTEVLDLNTMQSVVPKDKNKQLQKILKEQSVKTYCDSQGTIWLVTINKVYHLTFDEKGNVADIKNFDYQSNTPDIAVADLDGNGSVWIAIDGGLYKLSVRGGNLVRQSISANLNDLPGVFVQVIEKFGNKYWMGTNNGLFCLDQHGKVIKEYRHSDLENSLVHNSVTDITITPSKQLMLGTLDGVDIYDPKTDSFSHWRSDSKDNPLPSNFINCIFLRNGILWIGTESGGLVKLNPRQLDLLNFAHSADAESLSAGCVNAMYAEQNGTLWIGTVEGGLNRLVPGSKAFTHYTSSNSNLSHNSVSTLAADGLGRLWIGTWAGGINLVDMKNPSSIERLSVQPEIAPLLNFIGALAYDPYNKGMWIGSNDGIFFYDLKTKLISDPFRGCRNIRGPVGSIIDKDGNLWIGFLKGVIVIDLKSRNKAGQFKERVLTNKLDDPKSGIIDKICSFCQTKDGTLWLGSNGYGLYKRIVDKKGNESFKAYTMKEGLPNNGVKGIVEDKNGKLWVTTDNGLSHFDPETGLCNNYFESDGLLSTQFYWNSAVKTAQGSILLGGTKGLTILKGDNSKSLYKGQLRFTRLAVGNQTVYPDSKYLSEDIAIADEIRLHESDKSLEIAFSALTYGAETQGVYSYRLKGFEDEWVQLPPGQNSVRYTNLPSGNYTFEVKYASALSDTEDSVIKVDVSVTPYFWKSWWFITIALALLAWLVKFIYEKRLEEMRHHEAERLMKPIEEALKKSEEPKQLQTRIENILQNQHRIKVSQKKSIETDRIEVQTKERPFMERLTEVLEANYSNSEFGVGELSEALGINRTVLSKLIMAETGEPTTQFLRTYRLEIAKDMLLKNVGNRNITEIAYKVGFNDPKYFTRCFTKKYGASPSAFKA